MSGSVRIRADGVCLALRQSSGSPVSGPAGGCAPALHFKFTTSPPGARQCARRNSTRVEPTKALASREVPARAKNIHARGEAAAAVLQRRFERSCPAGREPPVAAEEDDGARYGQRGPRALRRSAAAGPQSPTSGLRQRCVDCSIMQSRSACRTDAGLRINFQMRSREAPVEHSPAFRRASCPVCKARGRRPLPQRGGAAPGRGWISMCKAIRQSRSAAAPRGSAGRAARSSIAGRPVGAGRVAYSGLWSN